MEDIYKKIKSGEIDIKYLSPIDLIDLEIYLYKKGKMLSDLLNKVKKNNYLSTEKITKLKNEIVLNEIESDN